MIHVSWVWVAWVDRAISGRATFSDDMAATTVARATHTTAVTAPLRAARAPGLHGGRYHDGHLRLLGSGVYVLERHYISLERCHELGMMVP